MANSKDRKVPFTLLKDAFNDKTDDVRMIKRDVDRGIRSAQSTLVDPAKLPDDSQGIRFVSAEQLERWDGSDHSDPSDL